MMRATINFYENDKKWNLELIDIRYNDERVIIRASDIDDAIKSALSLSDDIEYISMELKRNDVKSIEITKF
ncbi:hypothetical protein OUHCRE6_48930 [Enterobacter hormaechei subsp. steigerwaltii]